MGQSDGQDILRKNQKCCSYQNRNPDLSERRRNTVLSFIIIVIIDFMLSGLDLELLSLNKVDIQKYAAEGSAVTRKDHRLEYLFEKIR